MNYEDLDSFLHKDDNGIEVEEEKSKKIVEVLHKILRPFLLRRVKSDVEKNLLPSMSGLFFGFHSLTFLRERDQFIRRIS